MLHRVESVWVIARTTYGETVRRPLYYILLFSFGLLTFFSQYITMFTFYQEINMVREMGIATLSLWSFLVLVVVVGLTVTAELDSRTAVVVLSKPVSRFGFLFGKYLGLFLALSAGMIFLALVLFGTLWWGFGRDLVDRIYHNPSSEIMSRLLRGETSTWALTWDGFIAPEATTVLQGLILNLFHVAILSALCVSLAAFFPHVVTVAATTFLFIVGNISSYMVGGVERMGVAPVTWLVQSLAYLLPNLGYFNLQSYFGEGRIISVGYIFGAGGYAVLYIAVVFLFSGTLFERREVR